MAVSKSTRRSTSDTNEPLKQIFRESQVSKDREKAWIHALLDSETGEARMTRREFHQQIGPVASQFWRQFVRLSDEEAWQHFSLKGISRICEVFGLGTELLQFRS